MLNPVATDVTNRLRMAAWRLWFTAIALALSTAAPGQQIQGGQGLEPQLRTAYVINIIKFVSWDTPMQRIDLCINVESGLRPYLSGLPSDVLGAGVALNIISPIDDYAECDVLYVDHSIRQRADIPRFAEIIHDNLLAIGDFSEALQQGFAIQFFVRDLRLRFAINENVLKRASYKISSKLLRLARSLG